MWYRFFESEQSGDSVWVPAYGLTFNGMEMAKYSKKASEKVGAALHGQKEGKLESGSGKEVTSKKQAIAIGLSQARKDGEKVPQTD